MLWLDGLARSFGWMLWLEALARWLDALAEPLNGIVDRFACVRDSATNARAVYGDGIN